MLNKKLSLAGLPAIIGSFVITSSAAFAFPVFQTQAVKPQAPKTQKISTGTQTKTNTTVGKGGIKGGNTSFDDKGDKGPKDPKGGKLNAGGNAAFNDKGDKGPKDPKGGKLNAGGNAAFNDKGEKGPKDPKGGKLNVGGNAAFNDKGDKGPKDPKGGKLNTNGVDGINKANAGAVQRGVAAGAARTARP